MLLRSRPALQRKSNILKSTNSNAAAQEKKICSVFEKKINTCNFISHGTQSSIKASHLSCSQSNKENITVQNVENDAFKGKNTFKVTNSTSADKKGILEKKLKCVKTKDKINREQFSQSGKDTKLFINKPLFEPNDNKLSTCNLKKQSDSKSIATKNRPEKEKSVKRIHLLQPIRDNLKVAYKNTDSLKQPSLRKTGKRKNEKTNIVTQQPNKVDKKDFNKSKSGTKVHVHCNRAKNAKIVKKKKSGLKSFDSLNNCKSDSSTVEKTLLPDTNLSVKHYPVWKREPKRVSKRKSQYDIYDILLDEDIALDTPMKKKKRAMPTKKRIKIKKMCKPKVKNRETEKESENIKGDTGFKNDIVTIDFEDIPIDLELQQEDLEKNHKTVMESPSKQELDKPEVPDMRNSLIIVSKLLKELDDSFIAPKTSTPDKRLSLKRLSLLQGRTGEDISTIAEISYIPKSKPCNLVETILQTPKNSPKRHKPVEYPEKITYPKYDFEVNLFESPPKDLKKKRNAQKQKQIVLDLTETKRKMPFNNMPNLKLLSPRKSYHSPDLLTRHIAKTKRAKIYEEQKPVSKSRQELLLEKMNKEFDDISCLELCIE